MQHASWIWHPSLRETPNTYVDFRKAFQFNRTYEARISISACQEYMLFLNGELIGRGPSPCTPEWQYYDDYDVTGQLTEGSNVLAVVCYHFGDKDIVIEQMQGEAGFILELEADGERQLGTDEGWDCRPSPRYETRTNRISRWSGYNEIYVAEREDNWQLPSYEITSSWVKAEVVAKPGDSECPWRHLIPREIGALYRESVQPAAVIRVEQNFGNVVGERAMLQPERHGTAEPLNSQQVVLSIDASAPYSLPGVVYDFGREVVGRPILTIDAPSGGVVRLAYGESLELQYVDTFVLKAGVQQVSPYGRRACRFMQVTVMATPQPIRVTQIIFQNQHYHFQENGCWKSDDEQLNQIWSISRYTTMMNSHDHLEDCPWREKALWVADAVVMGKVIYHLFGDTALLRKCLLQGARIQNEDGSIPGTGPERNKMLLPDFCGHWLLGVRDYYRYSGDISLVEELMPALERLMNWFSNQKDNTGLFANATRPGFFCFIDWTEHIDRRDKVSAVNMLYYAATEAMVELCASIGLHDKANQYEEYAAQLKRNIREHLWLEDQGAYSDCMDGSEVSSHLSLQTNFLAAWCGLMSEDEIRHFLTMYYQSGKLVEIKGAFFQHIVLEVLSELGMKREALDLILTFWGAMAERGATTWWETFDPSSPSCTVASTYQGNVPTYLWEGPLLSQCHAWGASPGYILHDLVSGANVIKLGSGVLKLSRPVDEGPLSLQAQLPSKYGTITVQWERDGSQFTGEYHIPNGIQIEKADDFPEGISIHYYESEKGRQLC